MEKETNVTILEDNSAYKKHLYLMILLLIILSLVIGTCIFLEYTIYFYTL